MSHYQYNIECSPDYALLNVHIPENQILKVEASAMASMDEHISMKTKMKGGLTRLLSRESIFINEFTAQGGQGVISIAPGPAGDIKYYSLSDSGPIFLTGSSYVASTPNVQIDTKFQGIVKGFFSGESLFLMRCSGSGDLWFNTFGGIFSVEIEDEYIVDTGHIVAFTEGLDYEVGRIGGYKSLFFSGEGFICRFKGKGKIWIQTRNPLGLINWAHGFRVQQSNS
ncbi:MAG: TIGR00266 family protein [Oligoflexales bacterium]